MVHLALSRIQNLLAIQRSHEGVKLVSKANLIDNNVVIQIDRGVLTEASFQTVQIGSHAHLLEEALSAMNHSCTPNVHIDTTKMQIRQIRNIRIGDEITFFYPSTEWLMQRPFECKCNSPECLGTIAGASKIRGLFEKNASRFNHHIAETFKELQPSI